MLAFYAPFSLAARKTAVARIAATFTFAAAVAAAAVVATAARRPAL